LESWFGFKKEIRRQTPAKGSDVAKEPVCQDLLLFYFALDSSKSIRAA
jgi:hypothetical protein